METTVVYLSFFFSFVIGAVLGGAIVFFFRRWAVNRLIRAAERKAARMQTQARTDAKEIVDKAREDAEKVKASAEGEHRERRAELRREEDRVLSKTESLDRKLEGVAQRERGLATKEQSLEAIRTQLEEAKHEQLSQLERVSGMTSAEAKNALLERIEAEMQEESARRLREWELRLKSEADMKAQDILAQTIQRSASEIVSETTAVSVSLPSDEMKGRLIGREGRNIRALEQATGVDLIVDDTPEAVTLSSFDPVRREVARSALSRLIMDGRIHPARIEEVVKKAEEEVEAEMIKAGEQAAYDVGVHGLRPELIKLLGRLRYRSSYGQNVLDHSVEVAFMASMIASELGANAGIAKKAGLLHDIGKAVDREVEGTHAAIGADLIKQWEKSPEVVRGIAEHHGETIDTSTWGFIVSAADAISSARPGARRESLENYLKRLRALEDIANGFKGVDKSYAIQAGREIRILVKPEEVDDLASMRLARDIVKKIEEGLDYPGQIKVTVLRETRAVDYAK